MRAFPVSFHRQLAFTLPETMITMAIFVMVIAGVMGSYIFGLRLFELTRAKLGAGDDARITLGRMTDEIRSCWRASVGMGSLTSFVEATNGTPQVGSALQIYPTSSATDYIRYFYDPTTLNLRRTEDGLTSSAIMAHSISTNRIFSVEDHQGNVLTNHLNNRVVSVFLPIVQFQYPIVNVGNGAYYDYYQIRTKITRRKLE